MNIIEAIEITRDIAASNWHANAEEKVAIEMVEQFVAAYQLLLPTQDQCVEHNTNALREDIARQNILMAEAVDRLEARINELAQINAEILRVMREVR